MASNNEDFLPNHLFHSVVPVYQQNNRHHIQNQHFDGEGNRPDKFQGAVNGQNRQRHNNCNQVWLGERRDAREPQRGAAHGNQGRQGQHNFNRRNMSSDRNIMNGSRKSFTGSFGGRRHHSAVRHRHETVDGNANGRFEYRHDNVNGTNRNGQQRGKMGEQQDKENGFNRDGSRHGVYKRILGFKRLEELATKEPEIILITLADSTSGFEDLLMECLRPDQVVLVVKVLAKVCDATFLEVKVTVLANACKRPFIDQLSKHFGVIHIDEDRERKQTLGEFLDNVFVFCNTALSLIPVNACEVLPHLFCTVDGALRAVQRFQGIAMEDRIKQFDELQNLCVAAKKEPVIKVSKAGEVMQYQTPPNNYREINVHPNIDDIFLENGSMPFIRPNIVKGSYVNVEHYLDVQFRLLREDFIKPLREGIQEYLGSEQKRTTRFGSVKFYPRVTFLGMRCVGNSVGLLVCFDPDKRMRQIKWEFCRRFMFGSLLCFTRDNFHSIIFGKVLDRNLEDLKKGLILIDLCNENEKQISESNYKMIESEVYFEPYYHVMKALQNMTEDSFPMSQYIVEVQPGSNPPAYLHDERISFSVDNYRFPVLREEAWPSSSQLKLDDSQYKALRSALTKEFAVIQGPPGTGKTFLGLKVAKVLLKNAEYWNHHPCTPILVVCFTNHALDQFLEGLLEVTENLIRVGKQSKNERLSSFSLKERRLCFRRTRELGSLMRAHYAKLSELFCEIRSVQKDLEIVSKNEGIVSLETFMEFGIISENFDIFGHKGIPRNEEFLKWLTNDKDEFGKVNRRGKQSMNTQYPPQAIRGEEDDDINEYDMEDDNIFDDSIDFGIDPGSIASHVSQAVSFSNLKYHIDRLSQEMNDLNETVNQDVAVFNRKWVLEDQLAEIKLLNEYLQMRLEQHVPKARILEVCRARKDLLHLSVNERWILYRYWISLLQEILVKKFAHLGEKFKKEMKNITEIRMMDDLEVMRRAHVVGMTTTGAARLQPLLQALRPKIGE
ncbi:hypothetical protein PR048_019319 [Dryococelus australis]|uniref:NFX1-type zinc finger-containing protein 1 n=1 Tax=Dryococelus australis TaxID=614101 RepID=A0ABQ9H364_9NEOP|nr:hypothetical protein PR048_019319 [Dryococelus australis]